MTTPDEQLQRWVEEYAKARAAIRAWERRMEQARHGVKASLAQLGRPHAQCGPWTVKLVKQTFTSVRPSDVPPDLYPQLVRHTVSEVLRISETRASKKKTRVARA